MNANVKFRDINFVMHIPNKDIHNSYPGGNVQSEILKNNLWAREETIILSTILDNFKGLVIDVGANTGYFSFIALHKNHDVIAFEPNVIHTQYFMKTMELNNFPMNKLTHYELFVSKQKNDILFDGWSANESLMTHNNKEFVKTIAIDDVCKECLFLKIDVEGFEPDVINSAMTLIKNVKVPYIMFEITYIIDNKVDSSNIDMLHTLISCGYKLYEIQPNILIQINNIKAKTNVWVHEYFNTHQKYNPSLTNAGGNILAIHNTAAAPFNNIAGTNNYKL